MSRYTYRCRLCGQRLQYLRRTYTYRHIVPPAADHPPIPEAERVPATSRYERRLARVEHDS